MADIKALAKKSIEEVRGAAQELSRVKGWNLSGLQGLIRCAPLVVKRVETIGAQEGIKGADKRDLAIEILLQLIPLPWWARMIASSILPVLIDMMVETFKDKFGK